MRIKGVGVDIESVERFRKLPYVENKLFYQGIFTPKEIRYCLSRANPYPHFAGRFAAKEAVIKASDKKCGMKNIEILNQRNSQPFVNRKNFLVSISHAADYAIAVAVRQ